MKNLIFFLPVLLIIAFGFSISSLVKINEIECISQLGDCSDYLVNDLGKVKGKSLKDAKSFASDIFKKQSAVTDFSFKFKIPSKLEVYVVEKRPIGAVVKYDSDKFLLVDYEGEVLSTQNQTDLPIVVVATDFSDQKNVPANLSFALHLMYDVNLTYQARTGKIVNQSLEVEVVEGKKAIFPLTGNEKELVGALKLIFLGLNTNPEAHKIRLIDLRYKNPVLKQ